MDDSIGKIPEEKQRADEKQKFKDEHCRPHDFQRPVRFKNIPALQENKRVDGQVNDKSENQRFHNLLVFFVVFRYPLNQ